MLVVAELYVVMLDGENDYDSDFVCAMVGDKRAVFPQEIYEVLLENLQPILV
jgi:hypothetical protein